MTLFDAIHDEPSSPISNDSKDVRDMELPLGSLEIRNLIKSTLEEYDIPEGLSTSLLSRRLSISDYTKLKLNELAKRFVDSTKGVTDQSSLYESTRKYVDNIKELLSEDVSKSVSRTLSDSVEFKNLKASSSDFDRGRMDLDSEGGLKADYSDALKESTEADEYKDSISLFLDNKLKFSSDEEKIKFLTGSSQDSDNNHIDVNSESGSKNSDSLSTLNQESSYNAISDVDTNSLSLNDASTWSEDFRPTLTADVTPEKPDYTDQMSKTEQVFNSFSNSVGVSSDVFEKKASIISSKFSTGYSSDEVLSNLATPVMTTLSDIVSEILEQPITTIAKSSTFDAVANPTSFLKDIISGAASEIADGFTVLYETFTKAPIDALDEITDTFKIEASNFLKGKVREDLKDISSKYIVSPVKNKINEIKDSAIEGVLDLFDVRTRNNRVAAYDTQTIPQIMKFGDVTKTDTIPQIMKFGDVLKTDTSPLMQETLSSEVTDVRELMKVFEDTVTGSEPVYRNSFKINKDDLFMTNDAYWDIKITPHKVNNNAPPDINESFGCENGRLPLLSYSLEAGGLTNSTFEIYPGVQFSIPLSYSRPSSITVSIVNLVKVLKAGSEHLSCLDDFRDRYVKWVVGDNIEYDSSKLPACLDYHFCSYEIKVTKYSQQWLPLRKWELLGIPQVSIFESGSSSSTQEVQNLTFSIVGQSFKSTSSSKL